MVQITVKVPGADGQFDEWVIVELQGSLETRHPVPLSGKFIGDLHFTEKDAPVLIIGHHILHGKVVTLEKPLAVMSKALTGQPHVDTEESVLPMETSDGTTTRDLAPEIDTSYHIQAIIRRKILFKTRPKPIIAHVPKKL